MSTCSTICTGSPPVLTCVGGRIVACMSRKGSDRVEWVSLKSLAIGGHSSGVGVGAWDELFCSGAKSQMVACASTMKLLE
jgi:hypothetical protein